MPLTCRRLLRLPARWDQDYTSLFTVWVADLQVSQLALPWNNVESQRLVKITIFDLDIQDHHWWSQSFWWSEPLICVQHLLLVFGTWNNLILFHCRWTSKSCRCTLPQSQPGQEMAHMKLPGVAEQPGQEIAHTKVPEVSEQPGQEMANTKVPGVSAARLRDGSNKDARSRRASPAKRWRTWSTSPRINLICMYPALYFKQIFLMVRLLFC